MVEINGHHVDDSEDESSSSDEEDILFGKDKRNKKKEKKENEADKKEGDIIISLENEGSIKDSKQEETITPVSSQGYANIDLTHITTQINEEKTSIPTLSPIPAKPADKSSRRKSKDKNGVLKEAVLLDSPFDPIPDEVMVRIYSHLDVPSIGKLSQVCRRFQDLSNDLPMWRELATKRSYLVASNNNTALNTKSYYIRKFKSFRRKQELAEKQERERQKDLKKQAAIKKCTTFMLATGYGRPYEWAVTASIILATIFTVLKLDHVIDWSWFYVLIPFYFVVLHLIYTPVLYDIISTAYDKDFEDELSPEKHVCCSPVFYFIMFILTLGSNSNLLKRSLVYSFTATLSSFLVMYGIKAGFFSSDSGFPWWAVYLPLLIECFYGLFILISGGGEMVFLWYDSRWIDRAIGIVMTLLLMTFFILTLLKLDGHASMSWYTVLIPLFILKGIMVLAPMFLTLCVGCAGYSIRKKTRWYKESGVLCAMSIVFIILVILPLLTFEVLLAQRAEDDNKLKYKLIFTPIFIIEGCCVAGCVALNIMALTTD